MWADRIIEHGRENGDDHEQFNQGELPERSAGFLGFGVHKILCRVR
jgi:hypothetical protein